MKYFKQIIFLVIINGVIKSICKVSEDSSLTFRQLAQKYLNKGEEYEIPTEDGYILKLFHIPGNKSKPVLLTHGTLDSADTFILRGNASLAFLMSSDNYDIWAVNKRGNTYSRRHTTLNPDVDEKYWDFSFHEYGYYDVSAAIDYVLNKTGQQKLSVIANSEGCTAMYALAAARPEYNDKIKLVISFGPVCYLHKSSQVSEMFVTLAPIVDQLLNAVRTQEFLSYDSIVKTYLDAVCRYDLKNAICHMILDSMGSSDRYFEPEFLRIIIGHVPMGTSIKNFNHLIQIAFRKKFAQYNYGPAQNMVRYQNREPPEYDLGKVTFKNALIVSKEDDTATVENVALLRKKLPNVVDYKLINEKDFTHDVFFLGKDLNKTLYPYVLKLLNKYQ